MMVVRRMMFYVEHGIDVEDKVALSLSYVQAYAPLVQCTSTGSLLLLFWHDRKQALLLFADNTRHTTFHKLSQEPYQSSQPVASSIIERQRLIASSNEITVLVKELKLGTGYIGH